MSSASEPSENADEVATLLLAKLEELMTTFPQGVDDKKLQESLPDIDVKLRTIAINKLLAQGRLDLLAKNKVLFYKLKSATTAAKGGDREEKVVYRIIEQAGNKGIWMRDIRFNSNLPANTLNKILKSLEGKKLIKAVSSVSAGRRKVYMLFDLEPDRSLTGGAWYSDQEFESEFVSILNNQCFKYLELRAESARSKGGSIFEIKQMSLASTSEIRKYIKELGISRVDLSEDDIESILRTLIFDRKVEKITTNKKDGSIGNLYRAVNSLLAPCGILSLPCGICPVSQNCGRNGSINPKSCSYMKDWLE